MPRLSLVLLVPLAGVLVFSRPAPAQKTKSAPPPLSEFSIIEEKNLFHPDRIPQMPPSSFKESDLIEHPPEKFVLHGVIIMEGKKPIALLQEPTLTDKKVQSFVQGEKVGPYVLKSVKKDRVILALGGKEFEVSLYKPKRPPSPVRSRPPRRARPRPWPKSRPLPRP